MPLDGGVKLCPLGGACSLSSTTSSSRRQCDGGGRSGLFSLCNSSYSLWCPLWPLASGLWPLASGLWPKEADIRDLLVLLAQAHPACISPPKSALTKIICLLEKPRYTGTQIPK